MLSTKVNAVVGLCETSALTLLGEDVYTAVAYFNGSEANILRYPRSCNQV
jgi:hypothetical protein